MSKHIKFTSKKLGILLQYMYLWGDCNGEPLSAMWGLEEQGNLEAPEGIQLSPSTIMNNVEVDAEKMNCFWNLCENQWSHFHERTLGIAELLNPLVQKPFNTLYTVESTATAAVLLSMNKSSHELIGGTGSSNLDESVGIQRVPSHRSHAAIFFNILKIFFTSF